MLTAVRSGNEVCHHLLQLLDGRGCHPQTQTIKQAKVKTEKQIQISNKENTKRCSNGNNVQGASRRDPPKGNTRTSAVLIPPPPDKICTDIKHLFVAKNV